jgi:hypothetical protein
VSEREALEELQRRSSMHQPMYGRSWPPIPTRSSCRRRRSWPGSSGSPSRTEWSPASPSCSSAPWTPASSTACSSSRIGCAAASGDDSSKPRIARERGATRIDVVADPQAVAFYEAVGFRPAGEAQTRFGPASRMSLTVAGRTRRFV